MSMIMKAQETVPCPYEKTHVILKEKMQFHLTKCQYVNKLAKLVECPLNATHKVPECELNFHKHYLCKDISKIDTCVRSTQNVAPLFSVQPFEVRCKERSWDDDDAAGYDPVQVTAEKPILRNLQGVTPSERKKFRFQERRRLQQFPGADVRSGKPNLSDRLRWARFESTRTQQQENKMADVTTVPKVTENISDNVTFKSVDNDDYVVPRYTRRGRGRFVR